MPAACIAASRATARPTSLARSHTVDLVRAMRRRPREGNASKAARTVYYYQRCVCPLVVVPTILLCAFASLALLPNHSHWYGSPGLLTWSEHEPSGNVSRNGSVVLVHLVICPRPTICSKGAVQIILLAIARLSGYSLYVSLGLVMVTKCYTTLYSLRNTLMSEYLPLQWVHELHRLTGLVFLSGSVLHTIAHLIRWGLRDGAREFHAMLLHPTGISGVIAMLLLLVAVLPMWKPAWFRCCKLSFEARHWMHLCVVPMGIALCWHHTNILRFCIALFGASQHAPSLSVPTHTVGERKSQGLPHRLVQRHERDPQSRALASRPRQVHGGSTARTSSSSGLIAWKTSLSCASPTAPCRCDGRTREG